MVRMFVPVPALPVSWKTNLLVGVPSRIKLLTDEAAKLTVPVILITFRPAVPLMIWPFVKVIGRHACGAEMMGGRGVLLGPFAGESVGISVVLL